MVDTQGRQRAGILVEWLREQDLLRGPLPFTDYWASVLRLRGGERGERIQDGLVDPALFLLGVDRPELEIPRLRYYLLLFFAGPLLVLFRSFRRIGRYRTQLRAGAGRHVVEALRAHELELRRVETGRVDVTRPGRSGGSVVARNLVDPFQMSGFTSLFLAAYKLPLAAITGIGIVAVATPLLLTSGALDPFGPSHILFGFALVVLVLYVLFRDVAVALLGAVPVLIGAFLFEALRLEASRDWLAFWGWLLALLLVYLLIDLFFFPRPVPPTLLLYTREGDGNPYDRPADAPWWLDGEAYWVWRYLMLTPAEINKIWERDWERVDLWIRADGEAAGLLEWVVTDGHYRELWTPWHRLGTPGALEGMRADARAASLSGEAGTWLVEVDANLFFHTPEIRGVSFLRDEGRIPSREVGHVLRAMRARVRDPSPAGALARLRELRLRTGIDLLGDLPELIADRAARHILSLPWTHWRYPLGANRSRESRAYEMWVRPEPGSAADPDLQVKIESGGSSDVP